MIAHTKTQSVLYLWIMCMLATCAILPYSFELYAHDLPFPNFFIFQQLVYAALFYLGIILFAMQLVQSVGLETPLMETSPLKQTVFLSAFCGILYALGVVFIDVYLFKESFAHNLAAVSVCISPIRCILAMLYNAINEEIVLRLFVLTLCMWLLSFVIKQRKVNAAFSIFVAAVLFGLTHIPAFFNTTQIVPLTTLYLARSMFFNFLGGILFGFMYYRYGLIAAIVCHFSADLTGYIISGMSGLS